MILTASLPSLPPSFPPPRNLILVVYFDTSNLPPTPFPPTSYSREGTKREELKEACILYCVHLSGIYLDFSLLFPTFNEFPPLLVSPPANIAQVLHSSGGGQGGAEQLPRGEEGEGSDLVPAKRNQSTGKNLRSDVGILLLLLRERSAASSSSFLRSGHGNSTGLSRVVAVPVSHRSPRLYGCTVFRFNGRSGFQSFAASTSIPFTRGSIGSSPRELARVDETDGKRDDPPTNNNLLSTIQQQTISLLRAHWSRKKTCHTIVYMYMYIYTYIFTCALHTYMCIYIYIYIYVYHVRTTVHVSE